MFNTVAFALMGLVLAAGSVLHGLLLILVLAGAAHFCGVFLRRSRAGLGAFPGNCVVRHAKLAVPALLVLLADAAVAYVAVRGMGI
ncbi:hypothetical protein GGQ74_000223 [Desulfobaculum xiamenense]|uniref:Uncharacterized protein n=1 Tax=Desulfobaculum xiamenense TaxID=995050 RepID=A0A846QK76_9BACT|nr:hypothetical protein [Desulfobaculum xiamenense]NJB66583.1 hypothetical protein [Desulfobaculum xiamenense]